MTAVIITSILAALLLPLVLGAVASNRRDALARFGAMARATEVAFTTDSIPQAARDAALKHLTDKDGK